MTKHLARRRAERLRATAGMTARYTLMRRTVRTMDTGRNGPASDDHPAPPLLLAGIGQEEPFGTLS